VLCGWYTAEVGRQPWVVYHILRTADAITPSLTGRMALFSLVGNDRNAAHKNQRALSNRPRQISTTPTQEIATRAQGHHAAGEEIEPRRNPVTAEQHHAEERCFK
jgi:hypothetical protein